MTPRYVTYDYSLLRNPGGYVPLASFWEFVSVNAAQLGLVEAQSLEAADLVLAHCEVPSLGLEGLHDGQVVVQITNDSGFGPAGKYENRPVKVADGSAYLLYPRDMAFLRREEVLRDVLGIDRDAALQIINGQMARLPRSLGRLFGILEIRYLPQLYLVGQGYLAAQAEQAPSGAWGPQPIVASLAVMKWADFARSVDYAGLRPGLLAARLQVRDPAWWRRQLPDDFPLDDETIKGEWEETDHASCPAVRILLAQLRLGETDLELPLVTEVVVGLHKKLSEEISR